MITELPDNSRNFADTTSGVPFTGGGDREGKQASQLIDQSGHCTEAGVNAPGRTPPAREFGHDPELGR